MKSTKDGGVSAVAMGTNGRNTAKSRTRRGRWGGQWMGCGWMGGVCCECNVAGAVMWDERTGSGSWRCSTNDTTWRRSETGCLRGCRSLAGQWMKHGLQWVRVGWQLKKKRKSKHRCQHTRAEQNNRRTRSRCMILTSSPLLSARRISNPRLSAWLRNTEEIGEVSFSDCMLVRDEWRCTPKRERLTFGAFCLVVRVAAYLNCFFTILIVSFVWLLGCMKYSIWPNSFELLAWIKEELAVKGCNTDWPNKWPRRQLWTSYGRAGGRERERENERNGWVHVWVDVGS